MSRTIEKNGNDGLNRCCYSSQWNLRPLKSTTSFLQLGERESADVCKYLFSFCIRLRLNPRSSTGIALPLICCSFFSTSPLLLFLYVLLFFLFVPHTKQAHTKIWSDILCVSKNLPVYEMYQLSHE